MSLRYHFRGADADQLRAMRAAAALALSRRCSAAAAPLDHVAPFWRARNALVAAVQAFPALALRTADPPSPAQVQVSELALAEAFAAAWDDLDGDGTPWSYLCASLLRRELESALGLTASDPAATDLPPWRLQTLADAEPLPVSGWSWRSVVPADWRLLVMEDTRRVLVRFLTTAPPGGPAVLLHEDWYRRGEGYEARVGLQSLADWGGPSPELDGTSSTGRR